MAGRIPDLKPEELTERQKKLAADIAAARSGVVRGPFAIWLRNPDIASLANDWVNLLREGTTVPRRISELAILVTARHFGAQYEWFAHERHARSNGISDAAIDAIKHRRRPSFTHADEEIVYRLLTELFENKRVGAETYAAAEKEFGRQTLIELTTIASAYAQIALFLVAFEVPAPAEPQPLPG